MHKYIVNCYWINYVGICRFFDVFVSFHLSFISSFLVKMFLTILIILLNSKLAHFFKRCAVLPFPSALYNQQLNLIKIMIAIHNFFHEIWSDFYAPVYIKVWLDFPIHVTILYQVFYKRFINRVHQVKHVSPWKKLYFLVVWKITVRTKVFFNDLPKGLDS